MLSKTSDVELSAQGQLNILMIEDDGSYSLALRCEFEDHPTLGIQLNTASMLEEGLSLSDQHRFDAVLLDLHLPDSSGIETYERLRSKMPGVPVIVLSGFHEADIGTDILRRGAQDFLFKGEASAPLIARSIRYATERQAFNCELKRHARKLAESEARVRRVIAASADAMVVVDHAGVTLMVNPAAAALFEREERFLIGQLFGFPAVANQVTEVDILRRDGTEVCAEMRVTELDWDGKSVFIASLRDITERKQAERKILDLNSSLEQRVSERTAELLVLNAELEAFAESVSHDLRGPLHGVLCYTQLLIESFARDEKSNADEYLQIVQHSAQRMHELIEELLMLAHITRKELIHELVDVSHLTREVVHNLQVREPTRTVTVSIAKNIIVDADPRLLRIVLENLIGNAWKYTIKHASPTIVVGTRDSCDGAVCFYVRDNGAGFDMAQAHRLFVPFQRLHAMSDFPGTGIGLTTVQRIVHRHGGRIWAESSVGNGATFFVAI
jgi:signal transduction histidine kinase